MHLSITSSAAVVPVLPLIIKMHVINVEGVMIHFSCLFQSGIRRKPFRAANVYNKELCAIVPDNYQAWWDCFIASSSIKLQF